MPAVTLQVTTTIDSEEAAAGLARTIVDARLGACAQVVGPIRSTYRWEGRVETATEWMCVVKTRDDRLDALVAHIRAHHPYDTPEVVATPVVGGDPAYLRWVDAEAAGPA